ncbi:MAG: tRNA (N(6)-L-threonylcarbamoyladenosine(37)-C(2))-methylthiotransferase MtaB [Beijerinckiaceae bacterium]
MSVEVVTFGCRLNIAESEAIKRSAEGAGRSDLVVVNTCAVTAEATRQARQAIRRIRREKPGATIVVTGCAAQIEPERFGAMDEVDRVIGNVEKMRAETWTDSTMARAFGVAPRDKTIVGDIMTSRDAAHFMIEGFDQHTRAFVKVQDGCDHRCTFCVIPFGRGDSRSVPMGAVVDQVKKLVAAGVKEIVLTGVDVTSYGADLPGRPRLGTLVAQVLKHNPDLPRLRLSSLDVAEVDDELFDALSGDLRVMPYLHLSLQAGDDIILKRMKRRHSRAQAITFCERLRGRRREIVFGADFIAGFPTETDAQFEETLDLVDACGLTHLHVFSYSPRAGTPAARMPQVAGPVVKERTRRLIARGAEARGAHLSQFAGASLNVLAEANGFGRTEDFSLVKFATAPARGEIVAAQIRGHDGDKLLAA